MTNWPRLITAFLIGFALAGCANITQKEIFGCNSPYGPATCRKIAKLEIPMPPPPPKRFDKKYTGKLKVFKVPLAEMARYCGGPAWACSLPLGNYCEVVLPKEAKGKMLAALYRHELAHCNGWPPHHPK